MMDCFNSIIESIVNHLEEDKNLCDVNILKSYPATERPSPIDVAYVTVGFMGMEVLKRTFSDYIETFSNSYVYGRQANIDLKIKIYSPKRWGGEGCIEVFERVCDSLMFGQKYCSIQSIKCDKMDYDLNLSSLTLSSVVKIQCFIKSENLS